MSLLRHGPVDYTAPEIDAFESTGKRIAPWKRRRRIGRKCLTNVRRFDESIRGARIFRIFVHPSRSIKSRNTSIIVSNLATFTVQGSSIYFRSHVRNIDLAGYLRFSYDVSTDVVVSVAFRSRPCNTFVRSLLLWTLVKEFRGERSLSRGRFPVKHLPCQSAAITTDFRQKLNISFAGKTAR